MCNSHPHAIEILDCTLRDGGRLIDCAFRDGQTRSIVERLMQANIDIIEVGFLREKAVYTGDSTFFHRIEEAEALLPEGSGQSFALFIDYGYYPAEGLPPCSGEFKWGIRYGFTKKDLANASLAYYRGEKTQTDAVSHFGLGLYISSILAEKLGGGLQLSNGASGGAKIQIKVRCI